MTNLNQIDPSMLVLKMVGGALDGKLLPISTQKCFLTGAEQKNENQCAIIRGPSGTALKSTGKQVVVNDHADNLHWLREGDTIKIGATTMIVQQLGCYGETVTQTVSGTSITSETQVPESRESSSRIDEATTSAKVDFVSPTHPAATDPKSNEPNPDETTALEEPETMSKVDDLLQQLQADQEEALADPVAETTPVVEPSPAVESEQPEQSKQPESDSMANDLRAFLDNAKFGAKTTEATEEKVTPEDTESPKAAEPFTPIEPVTDSVENVEPFGQVENAENLTSTVEPSEEPDEEPSLDSNSVQPESNIASQDQEEGNEPEVQATEATEQSADSGESQNRLNNELLERALQSLKVATPEPVTETPLDSTTETPLESMTETPMEPTTENPLPELSEASDSQVAPIENEVSTEQHVDDQLNQIQEQIQTQIQSYQPASAIADLPVEVKEVTPSVEQLAKELEQTVEPVEQIESQSAEPVQPVEQVVETVEPTSEPIEDVNQTVEEPTAPIEREEEVVQVSPEEASRLNEIMSRLGVDPDEFVSEENDEVSSLDQEIQSASNESCHPEPVAAEAAVEEVPAEEVEPVKNSLLSILQDMGPEQPESELESQEASVESESMTSVEESIDGQPEEIAEVEEPQAPAEQTSVADVLARMQAQGQLDDFSMDAEPSQGVEPVQAEPAFVPEPVETPVPAAAAPQGGGGDGDSVQDYMNQLFQRLRGSDAPPSAVPTSDEETPVVEVPAAKSEFLPEPTPEPEGVLSAAEYLPQQQAPEEKSDLEAMRSLANKQKQAAVQVCSSKKSQLQQTLNQCAAVFGILAAGLFGWMSTSINDSFALAAFGFLCTSLFGTYRYFSTLRSVNAEAAVVIKKKQAEAAGTSETQAN